MNAFFSRAPLAIAATLLAVFLIGCATARRSVANDDPRLRKVEDTGHAIHGGVGLLYGRSG